MQKPERCAKHSSLYRPLDAVAVFAARSRRLGLRPGAMQSFVWPGLLILYVLKTYIVQSPSSFVWAGVVFGLEPLSGAAEPTAFSERNREARLAQRSNFHKAHRRPLGKWAKRKRTGPQGWGFRYWVVGWV